MFGSTTSSLGYSNSSIFGSPEVFGQCNQNRNPFGIATPFGSPLLVGTSTGMFGETLSPLPSSTTIFGAPSMPALVFSSAPAFERSSTSFGDSGYSNHSIFGSPAVIGQSNQNRNPFGNATPFGSPLGVGTNGGTSTGMFGETLSPLPSTTIFGAPSMPALGFSSAPSFGHSSSNFGS